MKTFGAIVGASACAAILLSACGGGDSSSAPPAPASTASSASTASTTSMATGMSLDTAQVLAQARETSETAAPYAVNDGAMRLTDTSDTSEPLGINGI